MKIRNSPWRSKKTRAVPSRVFCGETIDPDSDPDPDPDLDETMKPETLKPKRVEGSTALFG
ncbi:MAG TPA: hypothetical protein PLZ74_04025 [Kiritimatiellia bacterium]|jgi:hypothetical protein|nr:hypothetical protein [Kiritimatiellia bacterium]